MIDRVQPNRFTLVEDEPQSAGSGVLNSYIRSRRPMLGSNETKRKLKRFKLEAFFAYILLSAATETHKMLANRLPRVLWVLDKPSRAQSVEVEKGCAAYSAWRIYSVGRDMEYGKAIRRSEKRMVSWAFCEDNAGANSDH